MGGEVIKGCAVEWAVGSEGREGGKEGWEGRREGWREVQEGGRESRREGVGELVGKDRSRVDKCKPGAIEPWSVHCEADSIIFLKEYNSTIERRYNGPTPLISKTLLPPLSRHGRVMQALTCCLR